MNDKAHTINLHDVRKLGAAAGAEVEKAFSMFGQGIVSAIIPTIKLLPQGKAVKLLEEFWKAFDKAAPTVATIKRVSVTKSESMRIAHGIDAGKPFVGTWVEAVKAAPKRTNRGRKPRPTAGPAGTAATLPTVPTVPTVPKGSSPAKFVRQQAAMLAAFMVKHRETLPEGYSKAIATFAATVEKLPVPADE